MPGLRAYGCNSYKYGGDPPTPGSYLQYEEGYKGCHAYPCPEGRKCPGAYN